MVWKIGYMLERAYFQKPMRKKCILGPIRSSSVCRSKACHVLQMVNVIDRVVEEQVGPSCRFTK